MNLIERLNLNGTQKKSIIQDTTSILRLQSQTIQTLQGYLCWIVPELLLLKANGRPDDIAEKEGLQSEIAILKKEISSLTKEKCFLKEENQKLEQCCQELRMKVLTVVKEVSALRSEKQDAERRQVILIRSMWLGIVLAFFTGCFLSYYIITNHIAI